MLQSYLGKIIVDFCSYYGKSAEILGFENDNVPEVQVKGNPAVLKGFRNVVSAVCGSGGKTEDCTLQDQWIEYALTNAAFLQNSSNSSHILKELNEYLSDKVYFVGDKLDPADILLYLFVFDIMVVLTFQDKEKCINISRWFSNVQQDEKLRNWRPQLCFSRTRLYA